MVKLIFLYLIIMIIYLNCCGDVKGQSQLCFTFLQSNPIPTNHTIPFRASFKGQNQHFRTILSTKQLPFLFFFFFGGGLKSDNC